MYSTFKSDIESGGALRRGHQSPHPALTLDAPDAAWDVLVVDAEKSENPF